MPENIPAMIVRVREKWERSGYAPWKDDAFAVLDALESLSAPSGDRDDTKAREAAARAAQQVNVSRGFRDLTDAAIDAYLAARRPSPVTREALEDLISSLREMGADTSGDLRDWMCDAAKSAADALSRFSLPEPTEVEWAVRWTGTEGEPVTDLGADESDVRALVQEQEGFAVAVKRAVGPWVPVKGAEQ